MKVRWWTEARHIEFGNGGTPAAALGADALLNGHDPIGTHEIWTGGNGGETHTGTKNADTLDGAGGDDTIHGGKGDDIITGGAGADSLSGDAGNDTIHAGTDTDALIDGGDGNDTIVIDAAGGTITNLLGGTGSDTLDATAVGAFWEIGNFSGIEHFILSESAEDFSGTNINEIWEGRGGDDYLDGAGGNDTMLGGEGGDTLLGGKGNDKVKGENGDDVLLGGAGDDTIDGGAGWDHVYFNNSPVGVTANLKTGTATGEGTDTLKNIEAIVGSKHDDHLTGSSGDNYLSGLEGNDTLDGGGGNDTVYYNTTSSNVTVNLTTGVASGALGNDTLSNLENIVSGSGNDTLTGNAVANLIYGGAGGDTMAGGSGDDFIYGGNGNDTLTGGDGIDVLSGGTGNDHFVFGALAHKDVGSHYIIDAEVGETVDLSAIDAIRGGADQAFIVVFSFNGGPGEAIIGYDSVQNLTYIELDTDGGASPTANFTVVIYGDHLTSAPGDPPTTDLNIVW